MGYNPQESLEKVPQLSLDFDGKCRQNPRIHPSSAFLMSRVRAQNKITPQKHTQEPLRNNKTEIQTLKTTTKKNILGNYQFVGNYIHLSNLQSVNYYQLETVTKTKTSPLLISPNKNPWLFCRRPFCTWVSGSGSRLIVTHCCSQLHVDAGGW